MQDSRQHGINANIKINKAYYLPPCYVQNLEGWGTPSFGGMLLKDGYPFLRCVKRPNKHLKVEITSRQIIVQYNKLFLEMREIQQMSRVIITRCIQGDGLSSIAHFTEELYSQKLA